MSVQLKDYKILEQIGKGAFSNVFCVRDRAQGTYFAAKQLTEEIQDANEITNCPEVSLIQQVPSHPNLLNILDVIYENKRLTLIMELMDISLYDYIITRKRPLSENRARRFLLQVITGVHHLHRHGVFHRDIKPENILIKRVQGFVKKEIVQVGDFGTICRIDDKPPFKDYIATRWYRSPEVILTDGYYGPKMDIWAIGCCFFEMLTRKPLFPGQSELHTLELIHQLLGTPSKSMLVKIKHYNMGALEFRKYPPQDFRRMLPLVSAYGIDMLKKTLTYHADQRISASRLLKHIYFQDVTEQKKWSKFSISFQNLHLDREYLQTDSVCDLDEIKRQLRELPDKSPVPCNSAWSVRSKESILSTKTVHYFPLEGQRERNRALERLWDMNNTVEKQNLWNRVRDPRGRKN